MLAQPKVATRTALPERRPAPSTRIEFLDMHSWVAGRGARCNDAFARRTKRAGVGWSLGLRDDGGHLVQVATAASRSATEDRHRLRRWTSGPSAADHVPAVGNADRVGDLPGAQRAPTDDVEGSGEALLIDVLRWVGLRGHGDGRGDGMSRTAETKGHQEKDERVLAESIEHARTLGRRRPRPQRIVVLSGANTSGAAPYSAHATVPALPEHHEVIMSREHISRHRSIWAPALPLASLVHGVGCGEEVPFCQGR